MRGACTIKRSPLASILSRATFSTRPQTISCSICEEIFKEPKQLHCLHSFCLRCIEKWNETCRSRGQRLTCPTCRSREDGDVSKLRSSFYLDSLKQLLLAMRSRASKPDEKLQLPNCVSCEEQVKLVAFCAQCQGMVCGDCVNAHKKLKQFRDPQHQVVMFSDFKQEHVNSYISNQFHCEEKYHENHKLEYFCKACEKCICQKCSNTTHDNHKKISMEEKAEEVKQLINEDLNQVNRLKQRFVRELELSKQNIRRVENEIETAKKEVSDHIQEQIKILKDHENSTLTTLEEMFRKQKEANDEEQSEINTVIQQLDAVHEQGKALQVQSVDHFILQSQLPQRCEELLQRPSVLSSKPNQRNASVRYIPNTQVTLQDLGKVVQSVPDPSRCTIELENDVIRCGFVNEFQIVTRNSREELCYTNEGSIDVEIQDEDGRKVETQLTESETGKYVVTYKAEKPSPHQILVSIGGKAIKNLPMKVTTLDPKADFKPVKIFGEKGDLKYTPGSLTVSDSLQTAVVDLIDNSVVIFSRDGKCLRQFGGKGTADGEVYGPKGVVMYEDKILVCDRPDNRYVSTIQEYDVNGTYLRTIYREEDVNLVDMCTSGDNISVLSLGTIDNKIQSGIKLFSKHTGQFMKDIPISTAATCDDNELPLFIAYGNSKYFLSYSLKNNIDVYDESGVLLNTFGEEGENDGQFNGVCGLAVYGEEMLLVCDANNHRVQVFTQDGEFITSFGSYGSGLGQMDGPVDVAVTPDGKVFVLEEDGKRVQVWK